MQTVQRNQGRLLEVIFPEEATVDWIKLFASEVQQVMKGLAAEGLRAATFADLSKTRVMTTEATHTLIAMLRSDNPIIERTSIVLGNDPLVDLQIWRILSEANSPNRRSFTDPLQAHAWLEEIITDAGERSRSEVLLKEWFPAAHKA